MNSQLKDLLIKAISYSRDEKSLLKTTEASFMKLIEEVGELSETMLIERGLMPHKSPPAESSMGEAADVILMIAHLISIHNPNADPNDLVDQLTEQVVKKLHKWETNVLNYKPPTAANNFFLKDGDCLADSGGICDFCDNYSVHHLIALKGNRMAAGLCICTECYTRSEEKRC